MRNALRITLALLILLLGIGSVAFAEVQTNIKIPLNMAINNACLAEPVVLSGDLHVLTIVQPVGDRVMITTHAQPQGVSGTGMVSGATYHGVGVTTQTTIISPPHVVATMVNVFRIVGTGQAPTYSVHTVMHLTVNANGVVTADVDQSEVTCK